jgi:tRNA-2-methylthio-N6-dimethylallyladenosine synthase
MPRYFIYTFGCQSNKSDSERMAGDYEARGYTEASTWEECDELVVNTCAIRARVEHRARSFLHEVVRHFVQAGKTRPKIILTGCMLHYGQEKLRKMLPMVDEILAINEVGFNQPAIRRDNINFATGGKHAWVPISAGCNSFCTYCIVPYARGREQSRPLADIVTEVQQLAQDGYSEITLLGQNVNSWGLEKVGIGLRKMLMNRETPLDREQIPDNASQYQRPTGTPPFVQLLRAVAAIPNIKLIRFMTSNPWDFHDELIEEIATNPKLDHFIHLPMQSGSNTILHRMNRGYTKESYLEIIRKLRTRIPDIKIGTDIIVGFGGETDEDFAETVAAAQAAQWSVAFIAQYSPRPGTAAWRLYPDTIPAAVKKKRWHILDQMINQQTQAQRPAIL